MKRMLRIFKKYYLSILLAAVIMMLSLDTTGVTAYAMWIMQSVTIEQGQTEDYDDFWLYTGTVTNNGTVNVTNGFHMYGADSQFINNGTFNFTGDSTNSFFEGGVSNNTSFVNNGTLKINGVYNFGFQDGTSFTNNGTLYIEDIENVNLAGFVNGGIIVFPDSDKNSSVYLQFEAKNGTNGKIYTQSEFESQKIRYRINYDGLSSGGYYAENGANPVVYEWAAADPKDVTLGNPTLEGYEFLGWTGLDVTEPTKDFTFSSSVCKDVTVTAHWKPIVYKITYDLDGGSFYDMQTPNTEYSRGSSPALIIPYKNGYTFAGWIDTDTGKQVSNGTDIYYLSPQSLGDRNFKALFIANSDTRYKLICYYQNIDGSTYEEEEYLFAGETDAQVSVSNEDYIKDGFSFDSGNSGNILSGVVASDNSFELKLYFNRNKYTITYKSQDGSETLWTTVKYHGEKVGAYEGAAPSKESDDDLYTYVFDNWAREELNRDFGYDPSGIPVSENITFYAAFEKVRDENVVVIKWEEYDGFEAPTQTEIRLNRGEDYTVELRLKNENYCIGTKEWAMVFREEHIYWYDAESGIHVIEYTFDKENFEAPVTLTIPNVQNDIFINLKADYHSEHDYSPEFDTIILKGNCISNSVIRHFCYKCGKTYDETIPAAGHIIDDNTFETDNESHWKSCTVCNEKFGFEAHTSDGGTVTLAPTYDSEGKTEYRCSVCGYLIDEVTLAPLENNVDDNPTDRDDDNPKTGEAGYPWKITFCCSFVTIIGVLFIEKRKKKNA